MSARTPHTPVCAHCTAARGTPDAPSGWTTYRVKYSPAYALRLVAPESTVEPPANWPVPHRCSTGGGPTRRRVLQCRCPPGRAIASFEYMYNATAHCRGGGAPLQKTNREQADTAAKHAQRRAASPREWKHPARRPGPWAVAVGAFTASRGLCALQRSRVPTSTTPCRDLATGQ